MTHENIAQKRFIDIFLVVEELTEISLVIMLVLILGFKKSFLWPYAIGCMIFIAAALVMSRTMLKEDIRKSYREAMANTLKREYQRQEKEMNRIDNIVSRYNK